ncbi:MAG: carbon-nitrogen hydrolase family protein [Pseudomonadota bacterium]
MRVAFAQIAPVLLDREQTLGRVVEQIHVAADQSARLVAFGEALVPGYPFWVERTDGARFESLLQKRWHAAYQKQAVSIEAGDLDTVCEAARDRQIAVYLGIMERPTSRGGHSLYATLVYIAPSGEIQSTHRKLMPTYEERLVWATGDGHGLRVHQLDDFVVGGLNCWENWMPLPRAALYAQGETLHVAVWPGNLHNTIDITRFIAKESRSYVLSVSGLMRPQDLPASIDDDLTLDTANTWANGGSCLAGPDGQWVIEPVIDDACVRVADIDAEFVRRERHNFDPSGHYSRPDVTSLRVNRDRQTVAQFVDSPEDDQ